MTEKALKCAQCGKPATKRLTVDLDIQGIPLCDSEECELRVRAALWEAMEEGRKLAREGMVPND